MDDKPPKPQTLGEALAKADPATGAKLSAVLGRGALEGVRGAGLAGLGARMAEIDKERVALLAHAVAPVGHNIAERAGFVSRSMGVLDATRASSGIIAQAIRDQERASTMMKAFPVASERVAPPRPAIKIPPNPVLKTNELIGDLSTRIENVTELSAQQIDIQSKQVELIQALLLESMAGSTTQDAALRAAHRGNVVGFMGIVAGVIIALTPWLYHHFTT